MHIFALIIIAISSTYWMVDLALNHQKLYDASYNMPHVGILIALIMLLDDQNKILAVVGAVIVFWLIAMTYFDGFIINLDMVGE